jgi:15-cis-phytoene synthase
VNAERAFRHCEQLTRTRATNFYYGIRLLPAPKRRAISAVYAFARRVDDIGDGDLPDRDKLLRLAAVRRSLENVAPESTDPVLSALGHASGDFAIPLDAFGDLVDGVEMDVRRTAYQTFPDLEIYCRRVAGSIGRLSVGVFGSGDPAAMALADDLGVAMQLTNILRDIREDLARDRVYLPAEDLLRFGCGSDPALAPVESTRSLIRFEARRARSWFGRGLALLPLLDSRSASCVSAMTGIYLRILGRIEREPDRVLRVRVSLAPWEKAWVAARSLAGVGAPSRRVEVAG